MSLQRFAEAPPRALRSVTRHAAAAWRRQRHEELLAARAELGVFDVDVSHRVLMAEGNSAFASVFDGAVTVAAMGSVDVGPDAASVQMSFRVARSSKEGQVRIGLCDEDTESPVTAALGTSHFGNSIGYSSDGHVFLDDEALEALEPFGEGDEITVEISAGRLSFLKNGRRLSNVTEELELQGTLRFAVTTTVSRDAVSVGRAADVAAVPLPVVAALSERAGHMALARPPRWRDTLVSLDCDYEDAVIVAVKDFPATITSQLVYDTEATAFAPTDRARWLTSFERRPRRYAIDVLVHCSTHSADPGAVRLGVVMPDAADASESDPQGLSETMLGTPALRGTVALTATGDVLCTAEGEGEEPRYVGHWAPFRSGDVVRLEVEAGRLSALKNGVAVPFSDTADGTLPVPRRFRWAASLPTTGQAVAVGKVLTTDGLDFVLDAERNRRDNPYRFVNNVETVDCDDDERIVYAICDGVGAVLTEPPRTVDPEAAEAGEGAEWEAVFTPVNAHVGFTAEPIAVGVMCDAACEEHQTRGPGEAVGGGVAFDMDGHIRCGGRRHRAFRNLSLQEEIRVVVHRRTGDVTFAVGQERVPWPAHVPVEDRRVAGEFRFVAAVMAAGQGVLVGSRTRASPALIVRNNIADAAREYHPRFREFGPNCVVGGSGVAVIAAVDGPMTIPTQLVAPSDFFHEFLIADAGSDKGPRAGVGLVGPQHFGAQCGELAVATGPLNTLGYYSDGRLVVEGGVVHVCRPFRSGSVVGIGIHRSRLRLTVDGADVGLGPVGDFGFAGRYLSAVTLGQRGQCVVAKHEDVDADEERRLHRLLVQDSRNFPIALARGRPGVAHPAPADHPLLCSVPAEGLPGPHVVRRTLYPTVLLRHQNDPGVVFDVPEQQVAVNAGPRPAHIPLGILIEGRLELHAAHVHITHAPSGPPSAAVDDDDGFEDCDDESQGSEAAGSHGGAAHEAGSNSSAGSALEVGAGAGPLCLSVGAPQVTNVQSIFRFGIAADGTTVVGPGTPADAPGLAAFAAATHPGFGAGDVVSAVIEDAAGPGFDPEVDPHDADVRAGNAMRLAFLVNGRRVVALDCSAAFLRRFRFHLTFGQGYGVCAAPDPRFARLSAGVADGDAAWRPPLPKADGIECATSTGEDPRTVATRLLGLTRSFDPSLCTNGTVMSDPTAPASLLVKASNGAVCVTRSPIPVDGEVSVRLMGHGGPVGIFFYHPRSLLARDPQAGLARAPHALMLHGATATFHTGGRTVRTSAAVDPDASEVTVRVEGGVATFLVDGATVHRREAKGHHKGKVKTKKREGAPVHVPVSASDPAWLGVLAMEAGAVATFDDDVAVSGWLSRVAALESDSDEDEDEEEEEGEEEEEYEEEDEDGEGWEDY